MSNLEQLGLKKSFDIPSADEYIDLRVLCGLSAKEKDGATIGLKNSMFFIGLRDADGKLRAMGRVIGDFGCFAQVVDIAVDPSYQKKGLSRIVMEQISQYITEKLPQSCYVSLFADVGYLYEKFGFVYSEKSKGMYLVRPKKT